MEANIITKLPTAKEKEIENKFFKAFMFGGVMHSCFDWLQHKYNLGFYISKEDEEKPQKPESKDWQNFYDVIMPEKIKEMAEAFDDSVIMNAESPLIDEIGNNLNGLNAKECERYIYSLLTPFKEYSDNIHPYEVIKELKGNVVGIMGIKDNERDLKIWESMPQDEQLYDINGQPSGTPREQVEACKHFIKEYKYRIERAEYKSKKYYEIVNCINEESTVEKYFELLFSVVCQYATRLDALLLERGINLMWYQEQSGIYILTHRDITQLEWYLGSYKLARMYIEEAIPKTETPQNLDKEISKNDLPSRLTKDEALYYNKAIEKGFAKENDNGYKWLYNKGSKASLAYFLYKIFNPNGMGKIPFKRLDMLWGVKRLDSALSQVIDAKNPQRWRTQIDNLFTN
jgi:hypothetical protein